MSNYYTFLAQINISLMTSAENHLQSPVTSDPQAPYKKLGRPPRYFPDMPMRRLWVPVACIDAIKALVDKYLNAQLPSG